MVEMTFNSLKATGFFLEENRNFVIPILETLYKAGYEDALDACQYD